MNQDNKDISAIIQQCESLALEFKSDVKGLPDRDLIATVVSLANTNGCSLVLGLKNDGEVTGLHGCTDCRTEVTTACFNV